MAVWGHSGQGKGQVQLLEGNTHPVGDSQAPKMSSGC